MRVRQISNCQPIYPGTAVKAVCVMLPATADTGTGLRRKLYADSLAKQVSIPRPLSLQATRML